MKNLNLSILAGAIGRPARLRADRIRRDTLVQLAAALANDPFNHVLNALDALADAGPDAPDNEIDDLVGDIQSTARMQPAAMDLTPGDLGQLAEEAWAALPPAVADAPAAPRPRPEWVRHTEPTRLPQQRDRRAS